MIQITPFLSAHQTATTILVALAVWVRIFCAEAVSPQRIVDSVDILGGAERDPRFYRFEGPVAYSLLDKISIA